MAPFDDDAPVRPDGSGIRGRRRRRGWSRGDLGAAIEVRSREATGRSESVTRAQLQGIEDANERIPYATLCLIALGLDCNPVELLLGESAEGEEA
jgi:hypothetical protein